MPRPASYLLNDSYFEVIDSANKAYWLGVLAADGYIQVLSSSKLRLVFEIAEFERNWLEMFLSDIESTHPIVFRVRKDSLYGTRNSVSVSITRYKFVVPLLQMQIKTSQVFDHVPSVLIPHFIRGVFDGDGCISFERDKARHTGYIPTRHRWILTSHSDVFLMRVQSELFQYCSITPSKLLFNKAWRLQVGGTQQVTRIRDYLYPSGKYSLLPRKRDAMP